MGAVSDKFGSVHLPQAYALALCAGCSSPFLFLCLLAFSLPCSCSLIAEDRLDAYLSSMGRLQCSRSLRGDHSGKCPKHQSQVDKIGLSLSLPSEAATLSDVVVIYEEGRHIPDSSVAELAQWPVDAVGIRSPVGLRMALFQLDEDKSKCFIHRSHTYLLTIGLNGTIL